MVDAAAAGFERLVRAPLQTRKLRSGPLASERNKLVSGQAAPCREVFLYGTLCRADLQNAAGWQRINVLSDYKEEPVHHNPCFRRQTRYPVEMSAVVPGPSNFSVSS